MASLKKLISVLSKAKGFQIFLLLFFFAGCIFDIFFTVLPVNLNSDIRLFFFLLLWIFLSKISHYTSMATLRITIFFIVLLFLLYIFFPTYPPVERVASWVYMFLLISIVQQFFESKKINPHS